MYATPSSVPSSFFSFILGLTVAWTMTLQTHCRDVYSVHASSMLMRRELEQDWKMHS